ncbi:MAG TPA: hypothetical protein VN688_33705 [Gemmataceae bacterium]|nr:hypothetical protein [Gemmataceae bacterium]
MWPWIKLWRDWAMHELWPLYRLGPQPQAMHFRYEKAGRIVDDQPIPWNAEAVLVEAMLRIPKNGMRRKADFQLRVPGQDIVPAEQMQSEADDHHRVRFRLTPPGESVTVELLCRDKVLGQLALPFLSKSEFLQNLRLQMPTLCVRLGEQTVACQTFVSSQCRGLLASAVLTSPTSLVPMLDLELQVEFRCERSGSVSRVPAALCSSQLGGRQALVTVVPRRYPRRIGTWLATWLLGDQPLASQRVRGISQRQFQRSLRISDTRFVVQATPDTVRLTRQVPPLETAKRIGPCFLVSSGEPGMAGQCSLQITAQVPGAITPPLLLEQDVLITDGPTMVAPGTLDAADLEQVSGFELSIRGQSLGVLSLCPAPTATFTSEGGFKPHHEYTWSAAAEEEMNERLNRLLEGHGKME